MLGGETLALVEIDRLVGLGGLRHAGQKVGGGEGPWLADWLAGLAGWKSFADQRNSGCSGQKRPY